MREDNKRTYYVGKPQKSEDEYGVAFTDGYNELSQYTDLVSDRRGESDSIEKFGVAESQSLYIVHDDNDGATPDISIRDGVWLDNPAPASALVGYGEVDHMIVESEQILPPQYIVDRIQGFRTKHIFVLEKAVVDHA